MGTRTTFAGTDATADAATWCGREEPLGLLDDLLGGGQRRREYQDFADRYDQRPPWAGISDQEPVRRYH